MTTLKERFEEKFGKCTISLCDEHEKLQCVSCKALSFIEKELSLARAEEAERIKNEILNNIEKIKYLSDDLGGDYAISAYDIRAFVKDITL